MPLAGSGAIMGVAILSAIGNPDPKAVPVFSAMGDALASWAVANVQCLPGTMASAGAVVAGTGTLLCSGAGDLGMLLASAVGDPSPGGIAKWTAMASCLIQHINAFGQVIGSTFVAPTPGPGPLTGVAKVAFTNPLVTPPLGPALAVTDAAAAAMLALFGGAILAHIVAQAVVLPITTQAPFIPYTSPGGGGPITGAGSLS